MPEKADVRQPTTTRRRLLQMVAVTATGTFAGCSQEQRPSKTTTDIPTSSTQLTTHTDRATTTEVSSKKTLQTDYNSRKKFSSPGIPYDDFEDQSAWVATQESATADSSKSFVGSQSLKLSTDSSQGAIVERQLDSPLDISKHDISFAFRSATPLNVSFLVYLYDKDDNWAVLELRNVTCRSPDVAWFRTSPGVFDVSKTPVDLTRITRIKLELGSGSRNGVHAHVDDMRLHPKPDSGYVILSWDDGDQNYYEKAAPLHDQYDFPAVLTMPVTPDAADDPFFMTVKELQERQSKGDEVVAHASGNDRFAELSRNELNTVLKRNKRWLIDNDITGANFIVYPGNSYDKTALEVISKYFYMGGMNQSGNVNTTGVYGFDPLVLPRTIGSEIGIAKRAVTLAAKHRQCAILNFHNFNSKNTMGRHDYKKLLSHINSTSGIEVITFSDLWTMRRNG